jgi:O-antigen/teichoic acid export membrane protein
MLVVLAKLGTPEMVGQFALGLAVTAPIIMFANLQLRGVQATDARQEYGFAEYLGLRLVTTAIALLVIVAIAFVSGHRGETALVIVVVGIAKASEALSDVFYGLLQQRERMDRIAKSMMIKGPLSLAFLSVGVQLTQRVLWGVVGLAIAFLLVLVAYDTRSGARVLGVRSQEHRVGGWLVLWKARWRMCTLAQLAWLALPLGVVMMLISLSSNIPRYFISRYWGERELGMFAAIAYLQKAGTTVVGALGQSASPRLAKYYAMGSVSAFRDLLLRLLVIGALLGSAGVLVALLAGREILGLLYQPEYARRDVFVWTMVGAGIGYLASFLGYGMTAARYFRVQAPLFAFLALATTVSSMWLIPSYGLCGAAIALVLADTAKVCGSLAVVVHALGTVRKPEPEERDVCV